jgi:hypothetical protein
VLPEGHLYLVREPTDDAERQTFLRQLASPLDGRVLGEIRPGARNLAWLAASLLQGLGKDLDAGGAGRNAGRNWRRVSDWLVGLDVHDIFVSRIQLLGPQEWQLLIELAIETDARLWLIVQQEHLRESHQALVDAWPVVDVPWDKFEQMWEAKKGVGAAAESASSPRPLATPFPLIPDDDFTSFLAVCDRVLPTADVEVVERAYDHGSDSARALLGAGQVELWPERMRELVSEVSSAREAVARVRGAQATFFRAGWWLRLDLRLFELRWETQVQLTLTHELAAAFSRYPAPQWAATAALRGATRRSPQGLAELVITDGEQLVSVNDGDDDRVGRISAASVRAHVASRARDGAGASAPLFVKEGNSSGTAETRLPLEARGVQRILRRIGDEIGVELVDRKSSRNESDREWARRRGFSMRTLAGDDDAER